MSASDGAMMSALVLPVLRTPVDALLAAITLGAFPSVIMLAMSFLALSITVSDVIVSGLQHLAAGIVLSAVAVELVPEILAAPDDVATTTGMTIGFACGIGLFLLLGKFCNKEDAEDEDAEDDTPYTLTPSAEPRAGRSSSVTTPIVSPLVSTAIGASKRQLAREAVIAAPAVAPVRWPTFPVVLTVAVGIDAFVDGLLIGISSAGGANAGIVITVALSIEMGFLGLTFASSLRKQPLHRRGLAVMLPPFLLICGAALGGLLGEVLAASQPLHTGLLAFGVAALLYLVTEELLLEAHAGQTEEHIWWVDALFFVGFYLSFLLEKFT